MARPCAALHLCKSRWFPNICLRAHQTKSNQIKAPAHSRMANRRSIPGFLRTPLPFDDPLTNMGSVECHVPVHHPAEAEAGFGVPADAAAVEGEDFGKKGREVGNLGR